MEQQRVALQCFLHLNHYNSILSFRNGVFTNIPSTIWKFVGRKVWRWLGLIKLMLAFYQHTLDNIQNTSLPIQQFIINLISQQKVTRQCKSLNWSTESDCMQRLNNGVDSWRILCGVDSWRILYSHCSNQCVSTDV